MSEVSFSQDCVDPVKTAFHMTVNHVAFMLLFKFSSTAVRSSFRQDTGVFVKLLLISEINQLTVRLSDVVLVVHDKATN